MNKDKQIGAVKVAPTKIVKGEIDAMLAAGITKAKFRNKGVQKRLMKNQQKVHRHQERRDSMVQKKNKLNEQAKHLDEQVHQQRVDTVVTDESVQTSHMLTAETPGQAASRALKTIASGLKRPETSVVAEGTFAHPSSEGFKITDVHSGKGVVVNISDKKVGALDIIAPEIIAERLESLDELNAFQPNVLPKDFVMNPEWIKNIGDDSIRDMYPEVLDLDAPGMEKAKEAFRSLVNGTGNVSDSSQNMQEFRAAINRSSQEFGERGAVKEHVQDDSVNQTYPEKFDWAGLKENIEASGGIQHVTVTVDDVNSFTDGDGNPISEGQALELLSKDITIRPDLQVTQEEVAAYTAESKGGVSDVVEIARQLAEGKDVSEVKADEFTTLPEGFVLSDIHYGGLKGGASDIVTPEIAAECEEALNELNRGTPDYVHSAKKDNDEKGRGSAVSFFQVTEDDPYYPQKRRDFIEQSAVNRIAQGNTEGIYINPVVQTMLNEQFGSKQVEEKKDNDEGAGDNSFSLNP